MDELERGDALPEEELEPEVIEEVPEEAEDEIQEEEAPPPLPRKTPGALAWVVALLVTLFALVMLIPAVMNASLASYALQGLGRELRGDYRGAIEAYAALEAEAGDIEAWAADNFSFGRWTPERAPAFTTNHFGLQRYIGILGRLHGPLVFWHMEMDRQQQWQQPLLGFFAGRMPRHLRDFAAQVDTIGLIQLEIQNHFTDDPAQDFQAIEAARAQDALAAERRLYYDAIALMWLASEDPASDEVGQRLVALQNEAGHARWMTADVALTRARVMGDYALLARLSEQAVAHDRGDAVAMELHVRALFLSGAAQQAHETAVRYARNARMHDVMQLIRAELFYREGRYDESIALAEEIIAAQDPLDSDEAHMEATAIKGIALMLRGDADAAFALLQPYLDAPFHPTINLYYAALAAAFVAGEFEFLDAISPPEFRQYDLPQALIDLIAGETTLATIYTEGWGGMDA